jgi:CheY-like chemotaxis protein
MHQVILNLSTNASHAMRESGGVLELRLNEVDVESELADRTTNLRTGRYARLTVHDTGHGMDEATLMRVFDPYFTTKGPGEGTGMGLATVVGIVESSGGAVAAQSEVGVGTQFEVFLPIAERVAKTEHAQEDEDALLAGSERILIVDDEAMLVDLAKTGLEQLGYRVVARTSSVDALETIRVEPARFDVVVTDQTMPNMTGLELADELMKLRPEIPIILCTGFSELVDETKAKMAGIREYVMKPATIQDLAKAVRKVLELRDK